MAIAEGSTSYFAYKKEATANTEESGSGGKILRRATGTLNLVKPEVTSQEKRPDFQEVNVTHGTRSVDWSINSEIFGGDYEEFFAALCRKDFVSVTAITETTTSDEFGISSGVLTRGNGSASFITDGLYEGLVVRLTGMNTAGNNSRNFRITAMTATTLTLLAVDGGAAVADDTGGGGSASIVIPGEYTFIPSTAHTGNTFTIEKHETKTDTSHIARGNKVGAAEISVQPDQPPTLTFSGLGIDRRSVAAGDAPILTSPTAAGTGPAMSSGIGFVRVNGTSLGCVTGLTLSVDLGVNNAPVIFANTSCDIFYGRAVQVTGTLTVLKDGNVLSNIFDAETEVTLDFMVEAPGTNPKAFINLYLKRVKFNSADEDDPDGPVVQTFNFRAMKPATATGVNETTLIFQDSSIA
jgi:hypothetical protein